MDSKSSEGDGSVIGNENADKPPENPNSDKKPLVENPNSDKKPLVENPNSDKKPLVENPNSDKKPLVENPNSDKKPLVENPNPDKKPLVENPNPEKKPLVSDGTDVGSTSEKNTYIRGDKIDFKQLDVIMEKRGRGKLSIETTTNTKKQEWEIDLAKLDLKTVIAHGTYGSVYKAVYDGQDVAVKVLDWGEDGMATAIETANLRESFRNEVAVWHKLDHPNVTKFIGASMGTSNLTIPVNSSSNGGRDAKPSRACCVVVEYVAGGTLKEYLIINRKRKLAIKVVIQLALDLSRGLSYLHSKKIVHRDVKTENMLLDNKRTLKIADFGVARVEAQNPRDMTGETGTLNYMAPEILDGKPYDRKCDVYSFGICLWETYCCDMPYADAEYSFADLSYAVVQKNFRPEIPRCCPASLANIMRKCWDGNPNKRPNMDEVVRLLEAVDTTKGGGMIPDNQVVQSCFCFGPSRGP